MTTRVLILAGGQSEEHAVSLTSARSVLDALVDSKLDATALVIARDGRWLGPAESARSVASGTTEPGGRSLQEGIEVVREFDVVFPLLHGPNGEDGTVQGLLELIGVPYVGSGVLASAVCMDKVMSKDLLAHHGFEQLAYTLVDRYEWRHARNAIVSRIQEQLHGALFVKPANLGSSIGISKVQDSASLAAAIDLAVKHDRRVIVEQALAGARELEVGLMGNAQVEVSPVGEIRYDAEFYDYDTKYTDGRATLHIPAEIPTSASETIRGEATRAFKVLDCAGFARIDYFYQPSSGRCFLNEVNTIPGFTPQSMFPKLWYETGLNYRDVVERLVSLALERHRG
ncbi:MAG: D-alanine--D-alanine ligase family protein [Myxococcota bacterium]